MLKNSREEGGKVEIARGADWIQVTFGFDVTEPCQRSDNASRDVILRNGRMRGTLGEVGDGLLPNHVSSALQSRAGIQEETELEWMGGRP